MGYLNAALANTSGIHAVDTPVSGGGLSHNGKFSYGYASSPGKRSSMEDFYETRIDRVDGEIVGLFGVFDGHGGARAAEYVKQHLFSNLIKHPKFISDTKSAIAETYNHTDSEFLRSENSQNRDAGSTASTAILVGDRLLVANVGDSELSFVEEEMQLLFLEITNRIKRMKGNGLRMLVVLLCGQVHGVSVVYLLFLVHLVIVS
ncbi:hypothetical protein HPP92_015308 [Vanilla planifolia]|uniref:protein-serine/threonine phosphatase n=1 Tax=Vanilla planifolia TaxID=51239 RepID=A0A835QVN4_VANPL|nr:hypothetical protein HPP92_015308 [Vanilla planifolia]